MSWTYIQSTGAMKFKNSIQGEGYSGHGVGRNNPSLEWMHDVGPIPAGKWKIEKPAYNDPHLGPCVMKLEPVGHDAHGRFDFRIHGNNQTNDASHGCIILGPSTREMISHSDDNDLQVIP